MSRKSLMMSILIIVVLAAGAFIVLAQDDDVDTPPTGPGWGWMQGMHHGGMMHGGFGPGMMWGDEEPMMFAVAEALGLEPDALYDALRDGQALAEIADAQGVELETVYDAMFAEAEEHMSAMVAAGYLTQEQADEHLAWMRENIAEMPMFSGGGWGPCWGGEGGFGPGTMGNPGGMMGRNWNN